MPLPINITTNATGHATLHNNTNAVVNGLSTQMADVLARLVALETEGTGLEISDSFSGTAGTELTAHTGEIGATWTKFNGRTGDMRLSDSGRLYVASAATNADYVASGTPGGAEYDIEADLYAFDDAGSYIAIGGRVNTTDDSGYYFQYNAGHVWNLIKRTSVGGDEVLATTTVAIDLGTPVHIKLQIRDATKKLFVGGAELLSTTDNTLAAAGKVGMRCYVNPAATNTSGIHIDNLKVSAA